MSTSEIIVGACLILTGVAIAGIRLRSARRAAWSVAAALLAAGAGLSSASAEPSPPSEPAPWAAASVPSDVGENLRAEVENDLTRAEARARTPLSRRANGTEPSGPYTAAGTHHLVIVPVYWATETAPGAPSTSSFTDAANDLDRYYAQATGGQVRVTLDQVAPWTKIPTPTTDCNASDPFDAIQREVLSRYTVPRSYEYHVIAYMPSIACTWAGKATVPYVPAPGDEESSFMVLNGDLTLATAAHELGHNLGLGHSNGWVCYADVYGVGDPVPFSRTCASREYGDSYDVMGNMPLNSDRSEVGQLQAESLRYLSLLGDDEYANVWSSRTIRLAPLAGGAQAGVRLVRVPAEAVDFFIEYRTATGLDSWVDDRTSATTGLAAPGTGVIVRTSPDPRSGGTTQLINMHPEGAGSVPMHPGLAAGETFSYGALFSITVTSESATGATIEIVRKPDVTGPQLTNVTWNQMEFPLGSDEGLLTILWDAVTDGPDGTGVSHVDAVIDGVVEHLATADDLPTGPVGYQLPITEGSHTLQLDTYDYAGNVTTWGPKSIFIDWHPPVISGFERPTLLRGTVQRRYGWSLFPVAFSWQGSDPCGLGPTTITSVRTEVTTTTGTRAVTHAVPGTQRFDGVFSDGCGNRTWITGPTTRLAAADIRTGTKGTWRTLRSRRYLGHQNIETSQRGAEVSYRFNARSVGWIASTSPNAGTAHVYVDGRRSATVSLRSSRSADYQQVWTASWPTRGKHTLRIVNASGAGRPVNVDAISYIK